MCVKCSWWRAARQVPLSAFLMLGRVWLPRQRRSCDDVRNTERRAGCDNDITVLWALIAALPPVLFIALALRSTLAANQTDRHRAAVGRCALMMVGLGAGLLIFLSLSVGVRAAMAVRPYAGGARVSAGLHRSAGAAVAMLGSPPGSLTWRCGSPA